MRARRLLWRDHLEAGLVLEQHDKVGSAEQEGAEHVTLAMGAPHADILFEIHGRNLRHAHWHQCHETERAGIDDDVTAGLGELPPGSIDRVIPSLLLVPAHLHGHVLGDLRDLLDLPSHGEVVPMVVVDVEKGVGEHAAGKCLCVFAVRAEQLGDALETGQLDLQAPVSVSRVSEGIRWDFDQVQ